MLRSFARTIGACLTAGCCSIMFCSVSTAAPASVSTEYLIGVDDVLQVNVRPRADLNSQTSVLPDGTINLPSLGSVKASGLTANQLSADLTRRFGLYDRDITQVTVTVLAFNSRRVFLLGEVVKPGRYSFPSIPGLWDVVREGGGPTDAADLASVQIIRGEGEQREIETVDLGAAIATGDFSKLPQLKPGDTVRLMRKAAAVATKDQFYVLGDVKVPGVYSTQAATDVMSAIMAAGGPLPDANLSSVMLTRKAAVGSKSVEMNLKGYLDGRQGGLNPAIRAGDAISVREAGGGFFRRMTSLGTVLGIASAVITSVVAIESLRNSRTTTTTTGN